MAARSRPSCDPVTRVAGRRARLPRHLSRARGCEHGPLEVSLIAARHEGARARSSITGIVPAPSFDNAPMDRD